MKRLIFTILALPFVATASEPLSAADAAVLDSQLPSLSRCLEAAAADGRSTDGVVRVDNKGLVTRKAP